MKLDVDVKPLVCTLKCYPPTGWVRSILGGAEHKKAVAVWCAMCDKPAFADRPLGENVQMGQGLFGGVEPQTARPIGCSEDMLR
jgi:hypothetical protein